ncbi:hypothetical protein LTS18_008812, partial [Coniosporium uncinatum]
MNFLDDLSEEWIDQPRSSSPDPDAQPFKSSVTHASEDIAAESRSRIPRFRNTSNIYSSTKSRDGTSKLAASRKRSALLERSFSDNNLLPPAQNEHADARPSRFGLSQRSASDMSNRSALCDGTVAKKSEVVSPEKSKQKFETPEWKRRLINGQVAYGDQKDLFSPIGLQNMFQKPSGASVKTKKSPRGRGLALQPAHEELPSSPPVWPLLRDQGDLSANEASELVALLEVGEEHGESELPSANGAYSQHSAAESMSEGQSLNRSYAGRAVVGALRAISGKTETSSEAFSPVFVGKHTTINGSIGYAALDMSKSAVAEQLLEIKSRNPQDQVPISSDGPATEEGETTLDTGLQSETLPEDLPVGTPEIANLGDYVSVKRGGYSTDNSFERRPLSPSPHRTVMGEESANASIQRPEPSDLEVSVTAPPAAPTPPPETPARQYGADFLSPELRKKSSN